MNAQERRKYDSDFKRNAVQLTKEPGRTVATVTEHLGIGKDLIYRWRREHRTSQELAFPGNGREALTSQQQKVRELEKKLNERINDLYLQHKGMIGSPMLTADLREESEFSGVTELA